MSPDHHSRRAADSAELVDASVEALGGELERALPGGAGVATLEVRLDVGVGVHQVRLSDGAQHGGHGDVGYGELGEGYPFPVCEAALEMGEPARRQLAR